MTRLIVLFLIVLGMASPALARDDGGFGSAGFSGKAPAALGETESNSSSSALIKEETPSFDPSQIEPAAGDEEATDGQIPSAPVIQKEDKKEPDLSEYDLAP